MQDFKEQEGIGLLEGVQVYLGLNREGLPPVYRDNEKLVISYRVEGNPGHPYYLSILAIGPEGEVNLLFPNDYNRDNLITADREYCLPEPGAGYSLRTYGSEGKNLIVGIATETPLNLADEELLEKEIFPSLSLNLRDFLDRGIRVQAEQSAVTEWAVGETSFFLEGE